MDREVRAKVRELRIQEQAAREERRAYEEGQLAYHAGQALDANPRRRYAPHWARGWTDARTAEAERLARLAAPLSPEHRSEALSHLAAMRAALGMPPSTAREGA